MRKMSDYKLSAEILEAFTQNITEEVDGYRLMRKTFPAYSIKPGINRQISACNRGGATADLMTHFWR
jgi:hypothetical protein